MKYFWFFVGFVLLIFILFYIVVFTHPGNNIVRPIIQSEIIKRTMTPAKVTKFSLSVKHIDIRIKLDKYNSLLLMGDYSLLSNKLDLKYNVSFNKLQTLYRVTKKRLYGKLYTHGTITGTLKLLHIDGVSNIADSRTTYHITVANSQLTSITASVKGAKIQQLLALTAKPAYIDAKTNIDIDFKNITPHKLDGDAKIALFDTLFNYPLIKRDFNITLPKTTLSMNMNVKMKKNDAIYNYVLNSNLSHITSSGVVVPQPFHIDGKYNIYMKNLALLTPLTKRVLHGPLYFKGTVKGDLKALHVNGYSKTLHGNIDAVLKGKTLQAKLNNIQTMPILYILGYPGVFNSVVNADMTYDTLSRSGALNGKLTNGHFTQNLVLSLVRRYANVNLYNQRFDGDISTKIDKDTTFSNIALKSNNASIITKNMLLNSKTNAIKAKINIVANGNPLTINLSGNIKKPHVSLNVKKLLQKKASKAIKKQVSNLLKRFF